MIKPRLLISACLGSEKVRYNGQDVPSETVGDLIPFVDLVKVCPEYEIGLGVPREPIRIVKQDGEYRLIQHKTEKDVTDDMNNFSKNFVDKLEDFDGAIFKSKSPTMGLQNIKVYSGMKGAGVVEKCGGFFAQRVAKKYPGYPIEEDDRLRNKRIREHFYTKLFLFARYRQAKREERLKEFHEKNKLLFAFYNPQIAKEMDVSSHDYLEKIKELMLKTPQSSEIYLFFQNLIEDKDSILERYRRNKISLETLKEVSKFLIKDQELLKQSFYEPFPKELVVTADPDRDKSYWH